MSPAAAIRDLRPLQAGERPNGRRAKWREPSEAPAIEARIVADPRAAA